MTYREWMRITCSRFNMNSDEVELILYNQLETIGNPDDTTDVTTAKRALLKEAAMLIPLANIQEGDYSVSWNLEALKLWYSQTCGELGIPDELTVKRGVRNRSNVW